MKTTTKMQTTKTKTIRRAPAVDLCGNLGPCALRGSWTGQMTTPAGGRRVRLPNVPPFRFQTHTDRIDNFISRSIEQQGVWEPLETEIVCRLLRVYGTFIDIGANIGWYTVIAQRVMRRDSRIYAFEPEPGNFHLLRSNARSQRSGPATTLVQSAVSDGVGTTEMYPSPPNQGDHRIYASEAGRTSIRVPVTTIDSYFADHVLPPMLLKSDTQGSEPRIIRGSRQALSANLAASTVILEFWPRGMTASGESVDAFVADLAKLPHQPFLIDSEVGQIRPIDWQALAQRSKQELALNAGTFVDIVLLPPRSAAVGAVLDLISYR